MICEKRRNETESATERRKGSRWPFPAHLKTVRDSNHSESDGRNRSLSGSDGDDEVEKLKEGRRGRTSVGGQQARKEDDDEARTAFEQLHTHVDTGGRQDLSEKTEEVSQKGERGKSSRKKREKTYDRSNEVEENDESHREQTESTQIRQEV